MLSEQGQVLLLNAMCAFFPPGRLYRMLKMHKNGILSMKAYPIVHVIALYVSIEANVT